MGAVNFVSEEWIRWMPIEGLARKYYVEEISDAMNGYSIVLCDSTNEGKKIKIFFEYSVRAFRSTDESLRQETIYFLDNKYGTEFYAGYTFFKVINSEYIKWLESQSYGFCDSETCIHFSLIAADSIVDIIATYEPKIELYP